MSDRNGEAEDNIALLIDADNASPDHLDEVLLVLGELGTINIRRAYGNWAKASLKGWGKLTGAAFDHPDAAVRRRQGQERDRHAHDHRRHGPALSRQCRRLRDHVERQRLPAARPAHPRGRAAGLRLRHRQDPAVRSARPAPASSTSPRSPLDEQEALEQPATSKGQRPVDTELLQVLGAAFKASKRDEEGYASLSEMGQRAKAVSSFAARNYGFTRLSDLIKAVPNFEVKTGPDGRLLVKRLR